MTARGRAVPARSSRRARTRRGSSSASKERATPLAGPVEFQVVLDTLGNPDPDAVKEQVAFHRQALKLSRAVTGATNVANELATRLDADSPSARRLRRRRTRRARRRCAA